MTREKVIRILSDAFREAYREYPDEVAQLIRENGICGIDVFYKSFTREFPCRTILDSIDLENAD